MNRNQRKALDDAVKVFHQLGHPNEARILDLFISHVDCVDSMATLMASEMLRGL